MGVVTTSTTSKKVNYQNIKITAYDFLNQYTNGRLPIDLLHIINQIDNLHLMKYTTLAKNNNMTILQICDLLNSEDGALWYKTDSKSYILLYNDTITNSERIRFTIAHELGHYVLKHNEKTDKTILSRYNLSDQEYNRFETEANFFAKHLLVPFPVLGNYIQFFNKMDSVFIQSVFKVSYTVASFVINNLNTMFSFGVIKEGHVVEERFIPYLTVSKSTRICKSCHSKINRYSNYCHICSMKQYEGLTTLEAYLENKYLERERMKYNKYLLKEDGCPETCPKCDNEELENGNYCNVCGTYIRNICIGNYENNFNSFGYPLPIEDFLKDGCQKPLAGNSRFCPDCGGKSTYYFQGLLKNWDIEKQEYDEMPF